MYYYDYNELHNDIHNLATQCRHFEPDAIVAVARGGLIAAQLLAYALDVRNLQSIRIESYDGQEQRDTLKLYDTLDLSNASRILIVDDIVDSGRTLQQLLKHLYKHYENHTFKTVALYFKPAARVQPDFTCKEATEWIEFYWEKDFLLS